MFRPLSAIIPEQIDWTTNGMLAGAMDISLTQLRRDAAVLKELELIRLQEASEAEETPSSPEVSLKRRRSRRRKGFDRFDSEVMWLFRQLVRERGRVQAINSIQQIVEDFYHERDGQESSRAS